MTTLAQIEAQVEFLNRMLCLPLTGKAEANNGVYESIVGNIHTYEQNGGIGLQQYTNTRGCVNVLLHTTTKKECYNYLLGMLAGIRLAREGRIEISSKYELRSSIEALTNTK